MSKQKVWFITGTSTGFGRTLAELLIKKGAKVVATARDLSKIEDLELLAPERVKAVQLDVQNEEAAKQAIQSAVDAFGRIDVVVNNAGYGLIGALEELALAEIRDQFETNVFGVLHVTKAAIPLFRDQQTGHFINISSVGGVIGSAGVGIYNSSKFALEGISEALAEELAPLGVKTTIIEPGAFRTDWAGRSLVRSNPIEDYEQTAGATRQRIVSNNGKQKGDPRILAEILVRIAEEKNPPLRLPLGTDVYDRIRLKLEGQLEDLHQWKELTLSTDFKQTV
jgi:NAD(P)-dependent dehydrogenase (short-subunit alcohol dehydrogenase family)